MLRLAGERPELRVVDDQVGNPTSALDLAEAIFRIAPRVREKVGAGATFHVAGSGSTSWCGLAKQIFETSRLVGGPTADVVPISTSEYPTPAKRPASSRLDTSAFSACFRFSLRDWQAGVEETVRQIIKGEK
jgi:dTDP-4-dehydrorhamnose reductase